ncbi:MAG: hypothetical protein AAF349_16545 [Cyanobacteria bacterium P01_A01_bin.68]
MFDFAKYLIDNSGLSNQLKIAEWAKLNKTNPFDMGPKNYQRCLYDLKLGGKYHQLEYNEDGSLKYQ